MAIVDADPKPTSSGVAAANALSIQTIEVPYTDAAFKVAAKTTSKTLLTLSARQRLTKFVVQVSPTDDHANCFAGTGFVDGDIRASLGTGTVGGEFGYSPSPGLDVTQDVSEIADGGKPRCGRSFDTVDTSRDVVLHCTSTGPNFGNGSATALTKGKVEVYLEILTLPTAGA